MGAKKGITEIPELVLPEKNKDFGNRALSRNIRIKNFQSGNLECFVLHYENTWELQLFPGLFSRIRDWTTHYPSPVAYGPVKIFQV